MYTTDYYLKNTQTENYVSREAFENEEEALFCGKRDDAYWFETKEQARAFKRIIEGYLDSLSGGYHELKVVRVRNKFE